MKIRIATPVLALGLLTMSACGSSSNTAATTTAAASSTAATTGDSSGSTTGSSDATTSTVPDSAATVDVKAVEGIAWDKKSYTATAKNGKVTINGVNRASIAHNLYVLDATSTVIGDFINLPTNGSKGTLVLPLAPGTYHIVCKIPGHNNMNSTLTVS